MNNIIISFITFVSMFFNSQDEFISIEHVGKNDRIFPTVIISTKLIENEFTNNYIIKKKFLVENEVYCKFKKIIQLNKTNNLDSETIEYGSFEVALHDKGKTLLNYSTFRNESIRLLDQLIDILHHEVNNEGLLSELELMKKRITY